MMNKQVTIVLIGVFLLLTTISSAVYANTWLSVNPGYQTIGSYSSASWTVHTGNSPGCSENNMSIAVKYDTSQGGWTGYVNYQACDPATFIHYYAVYNGNKQQLWEAFVGSTPPSPPDVQVYTTVNISSAY